jgi:hypothetical protein
MKNWLKDWWDAWFENLLALAVTAVFILMLLYPFLYTGPICHSWDVGC